MTIAEMKSSAYRYAELWRELMPTIPTPGADQFMMWAGVYTEEQIARGISGAARKLRAMWNADRSMTSEEVARYASSIMRNEATGRRRFQ